ncbi:MAG: exodeoxyribonuclease VII large subunit [Magnetococcales bacterium]|nr:exodeoxyribonuclease VII large subunit [Magnetococcales bacterium]
MSVSELNTRVQTLLENSLPYFKLRAEINGLRKPASGHCYMNLIDADSTIRGVIWRSTLRRLAVPPREGATVIVSGRLTVYAPRGEYQVIIEGLKHVGLGDEREKLLQLHAKLESEGLFSSERKHPLPTLPRVIGVVTSATGAAIHDIQRVLDQRFPNYHLILSPCRVQGDGAGEEIAEALNRLNRDGRAEVIICGRGGGSAEDLACFNDERVVRAIVHSSIPVVSAVGHEVDVTLADLAADVRAATPSAAAERVMPEAKALMLQVTTLTRHLQSAGHRHIQKQRQALLSETGRLRHPRQQIGHLRQRCDDETERLHRALHQLKRAQARALQPQRQSLNLWSKNNPFRLLKQKHDYLHARLIQAMEQQMQVKRQRARSLSALHTSLSPREVLERGYAIVTSPEGSVINSTKMVHDGDRLHVAVANGQIDVDVVASHPDQKTS